MRRRGAFIVLVGPDGVGKTSVAAELVHQTGGVYCHFRPPLWRRWNSPVAGQIRGPTPDSASSKVCSVARIVRNLIRFWVGYLTSIRPALSSGTTVIADRWAYGYLAKPVDLRYNGPPGLSRLLIGWFPKPDIVAALVADPETIVSRKSELSLEAARQDVVAWSSLPVDGLTHFDANASPRAIAAEILDTLNRS